MAGGCRADCGAPLPQTCHRAELRTVPNSCHGCEPVGEIATGGAQERHRRGGEGGAGATLATQGNTRAGGCGAFSARTVANPCRTVADMGGEIGTGGRRLPEPVGAAHGRRDSKPANPCRTGRRGCPACHPSAHERRTLAAGAGRGENIRRTCRRGCPSPVGAQERHGAPLPPRCALMRTYAHISGQRKRKKERGILPEPEPKSRAHARAAVSLRLSVSAIMLLRVDRDGERLRTPCHRARRCKPASRRIKRPCKGAADRRRGCPARRMSGAAHGRTLAANRHRQTGGS